jgi:hypothetical protein
MISDADEVPVETKLTCMIQNTKKYLQKIEQEIAGQLKQNTAQLEDLSPTPAPPRSVST